MGRPVVQMAGQQLHPLVQSAPQSHVDFLKAPANTQEWNLLRQTGFDQRQG